MSPPTLWGGGEPWGGTGMVARGDIGAQGGGLQVLLYNRGRRDPAPATPP